MSHNSGIWGIGLWDVTTSGFRIFWIFFATIKKVSPYERACVIIHFDLLIFEWYFQWMIHQYLLQKILLLNCDCFFVMAFTITSNFSNVFCNVTCKYCCYQYQNTWYYWQNLNGYSNFLFYNGLFQRETKGGGWGYGISRRIQEIACGIFQGYWYLVSEFPRDLKSRGGVKKLCPHPPCLAIFWIAQCKEVTGNKYFP